MADSPASLSKNIARGIGVALVAALLWWHVGVLLPFALSLVLAYVLRPVVERLVAARVPRALAVALCLLMVLLTASVLLFLLVPIVSELVPMIRAQLPDLLMQAWQELAPRLAALGVSVPSSVDQMKAQLAELLQTHGSEWGGALWRSAVAGGSGLFALLGYAFLVPVLAFYWLMDWAHLTQAAQGLVPCRWRPALYDLLGELDSLMGQYLRGQSLVMLIRAVLYSVGLSLFGFNLALAIGGSGRGRAATAGGGRGRLWPGPGDRKRRADAPPGGRAHRVAPAGGHPVADAVRSVAGLLGHRRGPALRGLPDRDRAPPAGPLACQPRLLAHRVTGRP